MSNDTEVKYHVALSVCTSDTTGHSQLCGRQIVFTLLGIFTVLFCGFKVYRMHKGYRIEKYHLVTFYLALFEALVLTIHWSWEHSTVLHLCAIYLEVNQFLLICVFYGGLAMKVIRHRQFLARVLYPFAFFVFIYFTAVLIYSLLTIQPNESECTEPHWLLFSVSMVILAQLFLAAGIKLTSEMNNVSVDQKFRKWKKKTLWSLIIVFEVSALTSFWYDVALKAGSDDCDGMFGSPGSVEFLLVTSSQYVIALLLPVWVMLFLLRPSMKAVAAEMATKPAPNAGGASAPARPETKASSSVPTAVAWAQTPAPLVFDDWDLPDDMDISSSPSLSYYNDSMGAPLLRNDNRDAYSDEQEW